MLNKNPAWMVGSVSQGGFSKVADRSEMAGHSEPQRNLSSNISIYEQMCHQMGASGRRYDSVVQHLLGIEGP